MLPLRARVSERSRSRLHSRWLLVPLALLAVYAGLTLTRVIARKHYVFLSDYARWVTAPKTAVTGRPTHVFLLIADHFEPLYDQYKVKDWGERYRAMTRSHRDSQGRPPQHTWFYPGDQPSPEVLAELRDLVRDGYGEVELHFHHDRDTSATLLAKLRSAIADFQQFGFLQTADGETHFAFVHGNSGLDNSNGPIMCGVQDELRMLKELGCFADFTFPSVYEDSQPPSVNTIYAATDDAGARSYARQHPLSSLKDGSADLMIFEGPLVYAPSSSVRRLFFDLDDGNIHAAAPASPTRVERWIRANVHVEERPDWVFVKLFAHGISDEGDVEATTGESYGAALDYLERHYNDGQRYVLHYITAREAYNLARAAADGKTGEPDAYFDAYIPPYVTHRTAPPFDRATRGAAR